METFFRPRCTNPSGALKPSLVEWKLADVLGEGLGEGPLKPSLVEWKRRRGGGVFCLSQALETFLSGMETVQVRVRVRQDRPLETFLSGLDKELERSCPKNPRDTRKSSGKAS